ncbi:hypothetical protein L1987_38608 [Smallanthus sonchifolius]|uniref:Uncharacterized protein n=1 Tax=Smallanthus sonchifolius TaxID=185202 RepID=A0ACB9HK00_9ASTR|nr:hypothetical protein L1987_38608 [Smallanthus sonchifolius]
MKLDGEYLVGRQKPVENPMGVVGGIIGQALCPSATVFGGKSLATQISERFIALSGIIPFIIFGVQSVFLTIES